MRNRLLRRVSAQGHECRCGQQECNGERWPSNQKEGSRRHQGLRPGTDHLYGMSSHFVSLRIDETTFQENPVVAVLDRDLQGKGTHCSHCLRHIQTGMAIRPESDRLDSVYCSKECQVKAKNQYQNLLFGLEPPLPLEMAPIMPPKLLEERNTAQVAFVDYLKRTASAAPLLVAKFIARQVAIETAKVSPVPISSPPADFPEADGGEYTLYDHIERLRYLELSASSEEMKLLRDVLQHALPGLEQFVTEERHATLLGKMSYNAFGVCFSGGREDKVC